MTGQLAFDLGQRPALGREAFLVSDSNARALEMVDAWTDWPGGKLVLVGPEGAGKTHLAHVWAEAAGAMVAGAEALGPDAVSAGRLVIEDVDRIAGDRAGEESVFHAHNAVLGRGGRLMLTARRLPAQWGLVLPDLSSRVAAAGLVRIAPPDEALMAGILVKLFADRHIRARPALIAYLTRRIERSFRAAEAAVAALDRAALAQRRPVGVRLAAELLEGDLPAD
mgnify:CR=1 FL=1